MGIIKELPVWLPDIEEQTAIVTRLRALSLDIRSMQTIYSRKLDALASLKQSLLTKAFAGDLT